MKAISLVDTGHKNCPSFEFRIFFFFCLFEILYVSVVNAISQLFVYHDAHGNVAEGQQTSNINSIDGHFKAMERSIEVARFFFPSYRIDLNNCRIMSCNFPSASGFSRQHSQLCENLKQNRIQTTTKKQ